MIQEVRRSRFRHGLAVYGTIAFVAGFFGARFFATLNPDIVVVGGGIHFHHFWYGLAMVAFAGWLGIATNDEKFGRTFALIFGFGAGLIGDEIGLLLTFGDYAYELTLTFFVGAIAFVILVTLFLRFRQLLEREVIHVGANEKLTGLGILVAGFSSIFLASGSLNLGFLFAALGVFIFLLGLELKRRPSRLGAAVS